MNRQDMKSERGASLVEYALLIGAIAMVAIGGLTQVGGGLDERFTDTGDALQAVDASSPTGDLEEEAEEEADEPTAPGGGSATGGGGEPGEGGSGGGGEESGQTEDDGAAPDEDEGADPPDDEESDTDPLGEAGESGGIPGDSTDPDPDPVDDGDDGDDGGDGGDGAGSDGDASDEVSESVGLFGEFSVVFKVVDGKVVIGSVASHGWEYRTQVDNGKRVHMQFTNGKKGKDKKTVVVKAWLNNDGKLETSLDD